MMIDPFMALLVLAVVAAFGISLYSRLLGGVAGAVICIGVATWGLVEMSSGKMITFLSRPLTRTEFLLFMGGLMAINVVQIIRGLKGRRR